jgi:hypothetical protein
MLRYDNEVGQVHLAVTICIGVLIPVWIRRQRIIGEGHKGDVMVGHLAVAVYVAGKV